MTLTMRQQLAKGSKWKVKEDFTAENHKGTKWGLRDIPGTHHREYVRTHTHMSNFNAGDSLIVLDKSSNYHPQYIHGDEVPKGVFIPLEVTGRGKGIFLLKDIQDYLELEQAVEQLIYVMYSPSLGYIEKIPYSTYHDGENYTKAQETGGVLFSDKLTKAMKKKRMTDAKQFLLSHSGYYDGIDTSDIYYVFEPGGKKVDFPKDLVVQTIDKATKVVKETYDAMEYLAGAFRLRPLTLKYGGPVRAVFKDMEEKGQDFSTLLMFQDNDEDLYETSKKVTDLKAEFKASKLDKGTYIMKSDKRTVAFAFKNRSDAIMFRLQYSGDLPSTLVDSQTLDEVKAAA